TRPPSEGTGNATRDGERSGRDHHGQTTTTGRAALRQGGAEDRCQRDEAGEAGYAEVGQRAAPAGEESPAGHRHRPVRSATEGTEGPSAPARAPELRRPKTVARRRAPSPPKGGDRR